MPNQTKENIRSTALHLFAQNGYEAVSVRDIAGALGMGQSALYKHYKNKRAIFESIVARMEELDAAQAREYELPEGARSEMEEAYTRASLARILAFARDQFRRWTEADFYASFRKMLTLEQYRDAEMRALYQQYLVSGPLEYVTDLFCALHIAEPRRKAIELYAPMFLFYSVADGAGNGSAAAEMLQAHMERLCAEWGAEE